ncbi:uncharacterized protein LOC134793257 isoform X2 [Cydia splendana]|uniref:uncharacterized protein LOC134793257 isoform X2 n=1 Tax=Cydia splendana TaxID=1100963 RepID=UPI00300C3883
MGAITFLVSVLMVLLISEYQVLGCTSVDEEKLLKSILPKDDPEKQVGLSDSLGLKRLIVNLMLFSKLGLPDCINKLKRACESKNHEFKLEREMFKSSSKEKYVLKEKPKMIKDITDFGHSVHNRKDQSKAQIGLRLIQAFLNLPKLVSDQKDTLKTDYKSKNNECKLKTEMSQSSSKDEEDVVGKLKVIKHSPYFRPLIHNAKVQSNEITGFSKELLLKLAFFHLIQKFGADQKHTLIKDYKSINPEFKLKREMFKSSSKEERDALKGKPKVIKEKTDLGYLVHNRKDQSKAQIGLRLIQAFLNLPKLVSDEKYTLKTDYKSKNDEYKLKSGMFQSSSKEEKNDLKGKVKVIKDLTDVGPLVNNGKYQKRSNKWKQAVMLMLMLMLRSDQNTIKRDQENKNLGLKLSEMFLSRPAEAKDDMLDKLKEMKESSDFNPKNNENKDFELNHQSVLNNDPTGQFPERIPVMIISPDFVEIGWKDVFGRKSLNEPHKTCNNKKTKDVRAGGEVKKTKDIRASGEVKKLSAAFSTNSFQSDDHNEKNCECEGDGYKRIECNICQCYNGRWRCISLDSKKLRDSHNLNMLQGMSKKLYNILREKATGCVPGEKIEVDEIKECPCICVLPSLMECEVCPAVKRIHLPKNTATTIN